ncbi:Serine palmitoyltransferase 2 [Desmophyllum pertusum]|uniref:Serine palmitoyltransferase 2 n=1 Tax=Desmophyllum pertusum TaxID=174260 RepID=A0A9X0CDG1_9CNID|nr:Serine palmitoyltransferase 2 [Desmophyllum pertusum]
MQNHPSYDIPDKSIAKTTRQKWLLELCEQLVTTYIFGESEVQTLVDQTQTLQDATEQPFRCRAADCPATYVHHSRRVRHEIEMHGGNLNSNLGQRDEFGYYYCRAACDNVFLTKTTRNRHERSAHEGVAVEEIDDAQENPTPQDFMFNYHKAKLSYGLILFEFNDAIKEGDGERLFNLYKLALLLFKTNGHVKYAYIVLLYLCQVIAILPESEASDLKHNRFHNKYGGKEQLNKDLKTTWKGLGANLSEESASRTSNALEMLLAIMMSIDNDCSFDKRKGYRAAKNQKRV